MSQSYLLIERVDSNRERSRDLERDLAAERGRVDAIEDRAADARRRYADSGATVQALMEDFTYLRGELADLQHQLERTGQLSTDLEFQLTTMEVRLGHIEGQLSTHIDGYEPAPLLLPEPEPEPAPEPVPVPEQEAVPSGSESGEAPADASDPPEASESTGTDSASAGQDPAESEPVARVDEPSLPEDEAMFRSSLLLFKEGSWKKAGGRLQEFIRKHPDSEWVLEAQYLVGQCLFELGRYKGAITEFQKVIVRDDRSPWAPKAMLMQGGAFEALGTKEDVDAAVVFYSELLRLYPSSEQAALAQEKLDALQAR